MEDSSNTELNLEVLADECGIKDCSDENAVIKSFLALEDNYTQENLVKIYNYFLAVANNPKVLSELVRCIDKIRNRESLPVLIDVLLMKTSPQDETSKEDYENVRVLCAKAIANLKDTTAVHALLYCLNNKNENYKVRFACADALGKIGDRFAVTPLIDVMQDENEKSLYIKESAASALGMLGDARAIDPLVSILETKNGLLNKFTFLKERVLEALGKLKIGDNQRVFDAVRKSLVDESPQIRINAIEVLMNSDDSRAGELIKKMLFDSNAEVVQNAVIALYNLFEDEILEVIINDSQMPDVAKTAAINLKEDIPEEEEGEEGEDNE